jgi:hypothetical protein
MTGILMPMNNSTQSRRQINKAAGNFAVSSRMRHRLVAERRRKLASYEVAGFNAEKYMRPERTLEAERFSFWIVKPGTMFRANFLAPLRGCGKKVNTGAEISPSARARGRGLCARRRRF